MADNQDNGVGEALANFESMLGGIESATTRKAYGKAVAALRAFVAARGLEADPLDGRMAADWWASMRFQGLSASTASHYVDNISALHGDAMAGSATFWPELKRRIAAQQADRPAYGIKQAQFDQLVGLIKGRSRGPVPGAVLLHALVISLMAGCMPLEDVAALRKSDLAALPGPARSMAEGHADPRRSYLLPLGQSQLTPRQLKSRLAANLSDYLVASRLADGPTDPDEWVRAMWAFIAMRGGAAASAVVAALGVVPAMMPALAVAIPAEEPADELRREIVPAVAEALCGDRKRWFVMRMRPRVHYAELLGRLASGRFKAPQTFYPRDEIARRVGRRLVWQEKPVIADVVFFRTRPSEVASIFSYISDIAWCYKFDPRARGGYATIPDRSMIEFQQAIGKFTPDHEIAPAGMMPLGPDDRVVIIGGDYAGHSGLILSAGEAADASSASVSASASSASTEPLPVDGIAANGGCECVPATTVYRILLQGATGPWSVGIDARLLRPAPKK